jgi:DNA-directed RNA polymerases I, II, and III subunit RPABC5
MRPIRCFTCGKVFFESMWNYYDSRGERNQDEAAALDALCIKRMCCRRMIMTCLDVTDRLLMY